MQMPVPIRNGLNPLGAASSSSSTDNWDAALAQQLHIHRAPMRMAAASTYPNATIVVKQRGVFFLHEISKAG